MPKLLVFCLDALCGSDLEYMRTLPNFGWMLNSGALVEKINPVFPALTYPCHTSILTGVYVNKHGIASNEIRKRGQKGGPWHSLKEDVQAATVLDLARENGLTTCSLSWPVSGGADYDFNLPMIVPYRYKGYEAEKWLIGTSTDHLRYRYFYKHGRHLEGPDRSLDLFTMAVALDILEDFEQPDVMLIKMCDLDSVRHEYGVYHQKTKVQLRKHDQELGAIFESLRRKGTFAQTNFLVFGDHGQTDVEDVLLLNVLLKQKGFLKTDQEGNLKSFDAFCHSNDLTAVIELADPEDEAVSRRVGEFLESLRRDEKIQLNLVLDAEQAEKEYGFAGPFDFVIESALPIAFGSACDGDQIWGSKKPGYRIGAASHGGSPQREEVTTFFAAGPSIRRTVVSGSRSMVDLAPTMAKMLGFTMDGVDGKAIEEILR
ncbi:MAG: alkaline phosphatase family protein [Firmicutes bacterium]|nr:alkaline phosphatase family protein [Bacillota bacterium]